MTYSTAHSHFWMKVLLLPETPIQQVEAVEVVTTEATEEDKSCSPLPQSPPAEKSVGPSVPESREVKSRSVNTKFLWNAIYLLISQTMSFFFYI